MIIEFLTMLWGMIKMIFNPRCDMCDNTGYIGDEDFEYQYHKGDVPCPLCGEDNHGN